MKIFDQTKTMELTPKECDLSKGYLKEEYLGKVGASEIIKIYTPYTTKQLYIKELEELEYWFETDYKEMFEKCTRKIALGIPMKDGADPKTKLIELYSTAEINASRINELRNLISFN